MPPAKVLKTERTHEENQERAYIAASRRSDRSLEARVESARRASEIHKRRTGRSLRVTEQDVVNEEMYEEEDDDLPMQYRRLTAHLQTGSDDFNRRLSAYLTNHVAMRTAFDQAVTTSYAQQYPNAPHFAHNQAHFPSPFIQGQQQVRTPTSPYGQPYPSPGTPGYRPNFHARRASHSVAQGPAPNYAPSVPSPAMSTMSGPAQSAISPQQRPKALRGNSASQSPVQQRQVAPQPSPGQDLQDGVKAEPADPTKLSQQQAMMLPPNQVPHPSMSPFSMALPMESQMFLDGVLDPNDPMTSAFMGGPYQFPPPYAPESAEYSKPRSLTHPFAGMSSTLAPSALEMPARQTTAFGAPTNNSMGSMGPAQVADSPFSVDASDAAKNYAIPSSQDSQGSGSGTPGYDAGWEAFINDSSWTDSNVT